MVAFFCPTTQLTILLLFSVNVDGDPTHRTIPAARARHRATTSAASIARFISEVSAFGGLYFAHHYRDTYQICNHGIADSS